MPESRVRLRYTVPRLPDIHVYDIGGGMVFSRAEKILNQLPLPAVFLGHFLPPSKSVMITVFIIMKISEKSIPFYKVLISLPFDM